MLKNGEFLEERYEILERIGSGGMSDVYKAKCHKLNRLVAIKVLKEEFSEDEGFVSRFKMEAQAAAGLSHPNIVNVYDVVDDGDMHYIVMELIEGITLKNYIAKKGMLDSREAIGIAIQIAQGMAAAHDSSIIHRDIKPQNIIISKDGKAKVADFGIARAASRQTENSYAIGSVHYIAPEQASGGVSDERSDIYSFGITLYEMVTGKVPFDGESTVAVAMAHMEQEIQPPSQINSQISAGLEAIIMKCTQKKPEDRYGSATEVINDLRHVLMKPDAQLSWTENNETKRGRGEFRKDGFRDHQEGHGENLSSWGEKRGQSSPEERERNITPDLEKLFSIGGIAGAILLLAVLLFLIAQVAGLFKVDSGLPLPTALGTSRAEETIILQENQVNIPELTGITEDVARTRLAELSLQPEITYEYSDTVREGYVMAQDAAGTVVEKESTIHITISRGSVTEAVDALELIGKTSEEAQALLRLNDILPIIQTENSDDVEANYVIRYEINSEAGSVVLFVSAGPAVIMTTVPDISGQTEEDALQMLEDASLLPGDVGGEYNEMIPEWSVIRQIVPAGSQVPIGTEIGYVVSFGQEPAPRAEEDGLRDVYVASINEEFDLSSVIGPGSDSTQIRISIQLTQMVNGRTVTKTLLPAHSVSGDTKLSIHFDNIVGEYGVEEGNVEVVNAVTGKVLETYHLTFAHEE